MRCPKTHGSAKWRSLSPYAPTVTDSGTASDTAGMQPGLLVMAERLSASGSTTGGEGNLGGSCPEGPPGLPPRWTSGVGGRDEAVPSSAAALPSCASCELPNIRDGVRVGLSGSPSSN